MTEKSLETPISERELFFGLLDGPPELLRAILAFNRLDCLPEPDWPEAIIGSPLQIVIQNDSRLWGYFPRPGGPRFWDFREESRRLAFLDRAVEERLVLFWGAAVWAPLLAGVIARDQVQELRRDLGADVYVYALSRGRFHLGDLRHLFQEAAALTEVDLPFSQKIPAAGRMALAVMQTAWPQELRRLVTFGRDAAAFPLPTPPPALVTPDRRHFTWQWLKKILLTEAAPQWQLCFP